jgi:GNAT superfamily N-acetyltransferase
MDPDWKSKPDSAPRCWINMHSMVRIGEKLFDSSGAHLPDHALEARGLAGRRWDRMPKLIASKAELQERWGSTGEGYSWPNDEFLNDEMHAGLDRELASAARIGRSVQEMVGLFEPMGVEFWISANRGHLVLSKLVVKDRKKGIGTRFMESLVALADREGRMITLTADTGFGGSSVNRLKAFYKRFGFVANSGRNKDYRISDTMLRRPSEAVR